MSHLKTAVAQELVSSTEGDLDDASKLCELLGRVVLDVGDSLVTKCEREVSGEKKAQTYFKVGSELFHNSLPGNETFDEDICRFQVLKSDIFFYKRLVTGQSRISGTGACSGRCARRICVAVQIHDGGWMDGTRNPEIVLYNVS